MKLVIAFLESLVASVNKMYSRKSGSLPDESENPAVTLAGLVVCDIHKKAADLKSKYSYMIN